MSVESNEKNIIWVKKAISYAISPWNLNTNIGMATKSFRFFPLHDFSRSKSFFSIANFRPYMVFHIWRFINYLVKKKVSSFFVYLLFCIDLKWRFQTSIFVTFYFITFEKVKTHCKLGKSCMMSWSLTERQCQNWFVRFCYGDFDLKDVPRSGRPTEVNDDKIKAVIENNRRSTTREIAEKLNISHTCVEKHLKQLGYINKLDIKSTSKADIHQKKNYKFQGFKRHRILKITKTQPNLDQNHK